MYIQLDSQVIYYEKNGSGDPIILLHGNGGSHGEFDVLSADLELDYTVYAMDSRGQGLSATPKEFHYEDMAGDVIHFIETLGIEKPAVYGFSDGGIIGMMVAYQRPDLVSKLMISGANLSFKGLTWQARREIKKEYARSHSPLVEMMIREPNISMGDLEKIECPTLVLAGSDDMVSEKETRRIAAAIPQSELKILPNETHGSYVEHSHKLGPILRKFMQPEAF